MTRTPLLGLLAALLLPVSGAAQQVDPELAALSIGIAPFEAVAPPGGGVPDLAPALAALILAKGAGRTVSPATLVDARVAEPSNARVRELAQQHALNALVVGRVTRLGERLSLDVRLRDGRNGAVAGTYVAELPIRDPAEPVLDHLATQLLSGAMSLRHVTLAPGESEEPIPPPPGRGTGRGGVATAAPAAPKPRRSAGRLEAFDGSEPFSISSDELEATDQQGNRMLIFRRNVEATQGDLKLRADRLEASYPAGAKQPSRLAAVGNVRVSQGQREARCNRAEYVSKDERIVCDGEAVLRDGEDEIQGESVVFDLADRRVTVLGGTEVALTPSEDDPESETQRLTGALDELPAKGPVKIRASQLEASEDEDGGRRIRFEGSVEVVREDLILRAREIEGRYPPGANEPELLIASGDVQVLQAGREARCDRAVYRRSQRRVDCHGNASLRREGDTLTGEAIAFELDADRLVVSGSTRLSLAPRERLEGISP